MTTVTLTLDDELAARLYAGAQARGMDANRYAALVLADVLAREQSAETALLPSPLNALKPLTDEERHHALYGPARSLEESSRRLREQYNLPDLTHLTPEQLAAHWNAEIAKLTPEQRAQAEREGLL